MTWTADNATITADATNWTADGWLRQATAMVRAYRVGWFGGRLVQIGAMLTLNRADQFSPYWMTFPDGVPLGWAVEPFSESIADGLLSSPIPAEIDQQIATSDSVYKIYYL